MPHKLSLSFAFFSADHCKCVLMARLLGATGILGHLPFCSSVTVPAVTAQCHTVYHSSSRPVPSSLTLESCSRDRSVNKLSRSQLCKCHCDRSWGISCFFTAILFVMVLRCVPHYICSHSRLCLIHPRHLLPISDTIADQRSAHIRMETAGNKGGKYTLNETLACLWPSRSCSVLRHTVEKTKIFVFKKKKSLPLSLIFVKAK